MINENDSNRNYVSELNINLDIDINIKLDFYKDKETLYNLSKISTRLLEEIKKIITLEDPPYYELNISENICDKYSRNNNLEYMNNESNNPFEPGCKVSGIDFITQYKTLKEGIIVHYNDSNDTVSIKPIEYEGNGEIYLYDLKISMDENCTCFQHECDCSINYKKYGFINYKKSQIKVINGCLPKNINSNEKRFKISTLPTQSVAYSKKKYYLNKTENDYIYIDARIDEQYQSAINIPRHYIIDKKFNTQYILNCLDIFELLEHYNEMIPYFEKYKKINDERKNPSEKTKQLKNALHILLKKRNQIEDLIRDFYKLKKEQGRVYSSSNRLNKLKKIHNA